MKIKLNEEDMPMIYNNATWFIAPYILQVFIPFFVKPISIGFNEKYAFSKWHSSDTIWENR